MRTCVVSLLLVVFGGGCQATNPAFGGSDDDDGDDVIDPLPQPEHGFRITTPEFEIAPGAEVTYCYYFRTPNTAMVPVNHWKSSMTAGSHHLIMYLSDRETGVEGTITEDDCGFGMSGARTAWTYAAQTEEAELLFPEDDGNARALAQEIPPGSPGFFQMHYLNATDAPIKATATVEAAGLAPGIAYTQTGVYVTYNSTINVGANEQNAVETRSCAVPASMRFWMMSTHAHARSTRTEVRDGERAMFRSTDWEHPDAARFMTPGTFFKFATGQLTYECEFDSDGPAYHTGPSAQLDEMCMASGYYFPATGPLFCVDNGPAF
jgi:hypothetical protein